MNNKQSHFGFLIVVIVLITSACQPAADTSQPLATEVTPVAPTATQMAAIPTPEPSLPALPALAPDPQEISFTAADGQLLQGYFYPAAEENAPVVVLMHWVNGNLSDWYEVAPWLQNRGLTNPFTNPGDMPWWDPAWFPAVDSNRSVAVFIFSFRGCQPMSERGCKTWDQAGWLLDAQAAMTTAQTLEGVDPMRVAAIGSSIGADGAIDGCLWLNTQTPGACRGALSLSPGGYLTLSYTEAIAALGELTPPVPAWCLADSNEIGMCNLAATAGNTVFRAIEIPKGDHGQMLLRPDLTPLPMQVLLDFLTQVFE